MQGSWVAVPGQGQAFAPRNVAHSVPGVAHGRQAFRLMDELDSGMPSGIIHPATGHPAGRGWVGEQAEEGREPRERERHPSWDSWAGSAGSHLLSDGERGEPTRLTEDGAIAPRGQPRFQKENGMGIGRFSPLAKGRRAFLVLFETQVSSNPTNEPGFARDRPSPRVQLCCTSVTQLSTPTRAPRPTPEQVIISPPPWAACVKVPRGAG